jgi:hypothetical protein
VVVAIGGTGVEGTAEPVVLDIGASRILGVPRISGFESGAAAVAAVVAVAVAAQMLAADCTAFGAHKPLAGEMDKIATEVVGQHIAVVVGSRSAVGVSTIVVGDHMQKRRVGWAGEALVDNTAQHMLGEGFVWQERWSMMLGILVE